MLSTLLAATGMLVAPPALPAAASLASSLSPPAALLPAATSTLIAEGQQVMMTGQVGAQPVDFLYVAGVLAAFAFGARQLFDSSFPENEDEFKPPMPGLGMLDGLLGRESMSKEEAERRAEELRAKLQQAAAEGDVETAYRTEKELKQARHMHADAHAGPTPAAADADHCMLARAQLMLETGVRYMVNDADGPTTDKLPKNW